MILIDHNQLEQHLLLLEATIAVIRSGVGLTASTPELNSVPKPMPKTKKKKLKHETALYIAEYLGRPDFLQYQKF